MVLEHAQKSKKFLTYKKETEQYSKLRKKYREKTKQLEKIAQEAFSLNSRENTKEFLAGLLQGENIEIFNDMKHYLIAFYRS